MRKRLERRFAGEKIVPDFHIVTPVGKDGQTIPFEAKGALMRYNDSFFYFYLLGI